VLGSAKLSVDFCIFLAFAKTTKGNAMKKLLCLVVFIVLAPLWPVAVFGADPEPPTIPNPIEGWGLYVKHTGDPITVAWDANIEPEVTGYEVVAYNMEAQQFVIRGTTPQSASPSLTVIPARYGHHIFYVRAVNNNAADDTLKYSPWANSIDAQFTQNGKLFWVYAYIAPPAQLEIEGHKSMQSVLSFEAEAGQIVAPMAIENDISASGGQFIFVPGKGSNAPRTGSATFIFTVTQPGQYVLRGNTLAPSGSEDSFYLTVDGGTEHLWDVSQSTQWQTDTVSDRGTAVLPDAEFDPLILDLTAGEHTIVFLNREDGTKLDTIRLERLQ
jgi:hypothetical protein